MCMKAEMSNINFNEYSLTNGRIATRKAKFSEAKDDRMGMCFHLRRCPIINILGTSFLEHIGCRDSGCPLAMDTSLSSLW